MNPLVAFPLTDEQAAVQGRARELADTVFRERHGPAPAAAVASD